ncbi:MAG: excinuclease ABC subunit UvrC [Gammaproteobacteria bacterium]|nr:MAG: excinuclease ABC subunit UvrC [Gammaproteobacteria bacterium]
MPEKSLSPHFDYVRFLADASQQPGIYQMFGADGNILYVGKAKNLKSRLSSYFRKTGLSVKTAALVARIHRIEVTITASEAEALILEQNLIKSNRPPYNISLRDDKSYPYIFVSSGEPYPRISLHRGAKKKPGDYYGPFPNAGAVRESLQFLQKTFRVRQCEDSVFNNRSRPCLQYQIKRCTAPCVEFIDKDDYANDLRHTRMFLTGNNQELMTELADQMDQAAKDLQFEKAAQFRDQITFLRSIQSQQVIEEGNGDIDVIAMVMRPNAVCVHILFVRRGRILGSRSFFPNAGIAETPADMLTQFVEQFYLASVGRDIPREIITNYQLEELDVLASALQQSIGRQVNFSHNVRSHRAQWLQMAVNAAEQNLIAHLNTKQNSLDRFIALQDALGHEETPQRMECFDISHSSGELTVASCVVFDINGPLKSDYRRFNIEGITPGDDYAAMQQALERRYTRLKKGEGKMPDILLIDGGKGQLSTAVSVLGELGIDDVLMIGVAKGSTRKAGFETLYNAQTDTEIVLNNDSPALHLIQHIRDEAHRFAITGHKQRRDKKRKTSMLEDIPGVGAVRRRELLRHFGGIQEIQKAGVNDLMRVNGINQHIAEEIYAFFHND